MTDTPHDLHLPLRPTLAIPLGRLLAALVSLRRERQALGNLDAHLLRDIGITQDEARREARRPVWDAPGHWLR